MSINHLYPKLDQLQLTILNCKSKIDVCGITESFLNKTYDDNEIHVAILSYPLVQRDRHNQAGGSLVVYVSSDIQYKHRSDLECEDLECILIQIHSKGEKDFLLDYIYI